MRIIVFGPPGAGKGTVSSMLSQQFGIPHISTGNIFRSHIKRATELGKYIKVLVDHGRLVPGSVTTQLIKKRLAEPDARNGYVLDGYPRTGTQAQWVEDHCSITHSFILEIEDHLIVERLSGRRTHPPSGRTYHVLYNPPKVEGKDDETGENLVMREDDAPENITVRLSIYHAEMDPVLSLMKRSEHCYRVDARKPIRKVFDSVLSILEQ